MNKRLVLYLTGYVLLIESALMTLPLAVSLLYGGEDHMAFLISMAFTAAIGFALVRLRPQNEVLRAREGFAVVAISWIAVSFFGGLPFFFSGWVPNLVDCMFESASGFTTTGATILTDIEALPKGLLFWRSFTHWAGGMGVLVLSLALIPKMGARSVYLMRAESPGPAPDKLVPRVGKTAKILYELYIALSVLLVIALLLCGMNLYDALIHTFGAAGTGGFSNYTASVGHFGNPAIEIILAIAMALFGINFALYYYILQRNWKAVLHNSEMHLYCSIILLSTLIIAWNIAGLYGGNFLHALRLAFFQVSSIITTTGYATADFNLWPQLSRMLLVALMFIGGCAGSTGGGLKVVRVQILVRSLMRDIRRTVHPKGVSTVKLDGHSVDEGIISGVQGFFFAYMFLLVLCSLIVSLDGFSFETSVTSVIATLSNVGPGLDLVGPVGSFAMFSPRSKIVLTLCMIIGRLEIFPILMLLSPSAWRK